MAGINLSNLFGGTSSSMYSDMAAIRNGSYKRLLKSYYGSSGSSTYGSSGSTRTSSNVLDRLIEERKHPSVSESVANANSALTTGVSNLKSTLSTLQKEDTYKSTDGKTIEEKTAAALKNYVSAYNDTVTAAKKSNNSGMTSHVADMMKATRDNVEELSKLGIGIKSDGTLSFNEKKAQAADYTVAQSLFSSDDMKSYGYQVSKHLTGAGYYSSSAAASTSSSSSTDSTTSAASSTAASSTDLASDIAALKGESLFTKIKDEKTGEATYDIDSITSRVSSFINNYNSLLGTSRLLTNEGVASNLGNLMNKTSGYSSALKELGISVDKNGNLSLNESTFRSADMSTAQKTLNKYASSIETSASLVKYYATTNAGSASGYTANGSYNTTSGYSGLSYGI